MSSGWVGGKVAVKVHLFVNALLIEQFIPNMETDRTSASMDSNFVFG